ncbi:MAG: PhzF family phenazine biosynthesis protein [Lachnospiraceae bacterium]|nr:PhzF family phenazine biosynthesis protein [Lachnospiraceae bacterium]
MKQYIVDAFTGRPFSGNPAAVCIMETWPPEAYMKQLAMENSLSETAFLVPEADGFRLRWFTPGTEVDLCGHATLASAFVVLTLLDPAAEEVRFYTRSGLLTIRRRGRLFEMDLPAYQLEEIPVTGAMEQAFGVRPQKAFLAMDLVCVFETEDQVRAMRPDQRLLAALPGRVQNATAPGREADCVSRSFCPKVAVPEDPVCGSAHCMIANYWCGVLGKRVIRAYQASRRGGWLRCEMTGNGRMLLSGEAVLVAVSEILAKP